MTTAVNINGIEAYLPEMVDRFIRTVRYRGKKYKFLLYIEGGYLRIAQEHSPRFISKQDPDKMIGVYTPEIDPELLAGDIMAEVQKRAGA